MLEQDSRPAFDIQTTGEGLVRYAGTLVEGPSAEVPFSDIVCCQHKYEVARCFSAFLQQVNNEAIELVRGKDPSDPFFVRMLNVPTEVAYAP
jgi:hypothetical protein